MEERRGKKYRSDAEQREIVERWEASGAGVHDFCAGEGVNVSLFYKWRRKLRGAGSAEALQFVEVKRRNAPGVSVSVECRNGRRVVVQGLTLKEVLVAAEGA